MRSDAKTEGECELLGVGRCYTAGIEELGVLSVEFFV